MHVWLVEALDLDRKEALMTAWCFFIEGELHRVFATADLAEKYLQCMQEEYSDVDMYYVNMEVETK